MLDSSAFSPKTKELRLSEDLTHLTEIQANVARLIPSAIDDLMDNPDEHIRRLGNRVSQFFTSGHDSIKNLIYFDNTPVVTDPSIEFRFINNPVPGSTSQNISYLRAEEPELVGRLIVTSPDSFSTYHTGWKDLPTEDRYALLFALAIFGLYLETEEPPYTENSRRSPVKDMLERQNITFINNLNRVYAYLAEKLVVNEGFDYTRLIPEAVKKGGFGVEDIANIARSKFSMEDSSISYQKFLIALQNLNNKGFLPTTYARYFIEFRARTIGELSFSSVQDEPSEIFFNFARALMAA